MSQSGLTTDEKLCMQFWFRQAIATVERQEALERLLRKSSSEETLPTHGHSSVPRRAKRVSAPFQTKELAY
jgi:hypothetical protein